MSILERFSQEEMGKYSIFQGRENLVLQEISDNKDKEDNFPSGTADSVSRNIVHSGTER